MIRPARTADHDRLLDLWEALQANGHAADPRYRPMPDARQVMSPWVRRSWYALEPFPHTLVWEQDGIHGFIGGHPRAALPVVDLQPTARIGDLYVAETHRRHGVGRALFERFAANARSAGFPRLEVGTLDLDRRARAFWESVGFSAWQVTLEQ